MKLLNSSSYASIDRGYEYAKRNQVLLVEKITDTSFDGVVKGSKDDPYNVHIDIDKIRQSTCNCPFTEGNKKICKHMIAVYFVAFPDELKKYELEVIVSEEMAEVFRLEQEKKLFRIINGFKKQELREALIGILESGPDWQCERFIRDYVDCLED